jgi:hypothetical protein
MLANYIPDPGNIYLLVCLAGFLTCSVLSSLPIFPVISYQSSVIIIYC